MLGEGSTKEMILQKILELFETLPDNDEQAPEVKPEAEVAIEIAPKDKAAL